MTPRINEAIEVFLKAIENGTLAKGNCVACAVGNLVANSKGEILTKENIRSGGMRIYWRYLFVTESSDEPQKKRDGNKEEIRLGLEEISKTKFTEDELAQIEHAFERNTKIEWLRYESYSKEEIRQDQIKGLEAVVQVMLDFDDCKDLVSEIFTARAEAIPV
jgi:hypothetical protein